MSISHVSDASFDSDVLNASGPVLVDFWAEWCGPCKQIAPALVEIAAEMEGRLTVAKVNIDENPGTPTKYGVRGIPTLILFKNGQAAATKIGTLTKSKLVEWVEAVLEGLYSIRGFPVWGLCDSRSLTARRPNLSNLCWRSDDVGSRIEPLLPGGRRGIP